MDADIQKVFQHWVDTMQKTARAKLDTNRRYRIQRALDAYGLDDTMNAITGCSLSEFHMGHNRRRKVYNELTLILRNSEKIERFLDVYDRQGVSQAAKEFLND